MRGLLLKRRHAVNAESKWRSFFVNLALVAGSVILALMIGEGVFRLLSQEKAELHGMYTRDDSAGIALTPGFRGHMRTAEFEYDVAINDLGMRDGPVRSKEPPAKRVLIIGDSFVFGVGVHLKDSLAKALARHLVSRLPSTPIEVFNAGVPGASPFQELHYLRRLAPVVMPDVVIQVLFVGDDWYGNTMRTPPEEAQKSIEERLRLHSSLYRFIDRFVLTRLKGRQHYSIHRVQPDPELVQRMARVLQLLGQARTTTEEHGARFLVVLCPRYSQVYADAWAKARLVYRLPAEEYSPLQPNGIFVKRLGARGFQYLDLLGPLQEESRRRMLHFPVDGHWNVEGNDFVASLLAKDIAPWIETSTNKGG